MKSYTFFINADNGVELETTAGSGDAIGMGTTRVIGKFNSVFSAIKRLQELREEDGHSWHGSAKITGKNDYLSLPMSSRSYIIENGRIFDDEGNTYPVDVLTSADFLYFCIYR